MKSAFTPPPVVSTDVIFESPYLRVRRVVKRMPIGDHTTFYLRDEADVAICLPVTPDGLFVLLDEYRHGPERPLCEIPGGSVDPGEDPVQAATRETLEETGYAGRMTLLCTTWISAYSTARKHICLMRDAVQVSQPKLDSGEMSRVLLLTRTEFEAELRAGNLTDLDGGLLCLQMLDGLSL